MLQEAPGQTAATSEVAGQWPLLQHQHHSRALGKPVTLLTDQLSLFSLRRQAKGDKSCWCHHQLLAGTLLWTASAGGCSSSSTDRCECEHWEKGVAPPSSGLKSGEQQPSRSTTHRFISWHLVVTPDEEGGAVISSIKCGWPRALSSRVQLQVPLDCSRSTLNNHNLGGKREKELTPKSSEKP